MPRNNSTGHGLQNQVATQPGGLTKSQPARFLRLLGLFVLSLLVGFNVIFFAVRLPLQAPYVDAALLGSFVLLLFAGPTWLELFAVGLAALLLAFLRARLTGAPGLIAALPGTVGFILGFASLLVLGIGVAWCRPADRSRKIAALLASAGLPLFAILTMVTFHYANRTHAMTFDAFLFAFDGALGFQPSFLIGGVMSRIAIMRFMAAIAYEGLPLGIAIVYGSSMFRAVPSGRRNLLLILLCAGVTGCLLYEVLPATGPRFVFPSFPMSPPAATIVPRLIPVDVSAPRNAMPSLHLAWALLLYWNARAERFWVRTVAAFFLIFTFVATLGFGEHYLIDLVVAVPFAVMIQSACSPAIQLNHPDRLRPLLAACGMVGAWLLALRFLSPFLIGLGLLNWVLIAATVLYSCKLERQLNQRVTDRLAGDVRACPGGRLSTSTA